MAVSQNKGYLLGVPIIRLVYLGVHIGVPLLSREVNLESSGRGTSRRGQVGAFLTDGAGVSDGCWADGLE